MARFAWTAAALCVAAAAVAAQAPHPDQAPSFRAGVELVRLDVRVTAEDGRPIHDLKQDDVEVIQDGKLRPVVLFQHVELPTAPLDEVTRRTVSAEVSTNRGSPRGHLYVLVFDQAHIAPGNEQRARLAAERFLKTRVRPGDRVAAYAIPGPGLQIGFTADTKRIADGLVTVRGMADTGQVGPIGTMSQQEAFAIVRGDQAVLQRVADRAQAEVAPTDITRAAVAGAASGGTTATANTQLVQEDARRLANQADAQSRQMMAMLADILRPMSAIEGRKTILFISEGFYGDRLERDIEDLAAAAAQSYSVIDAIDINRRDLDIRTDVPTGGDQYSGIHDRLAPLASMALETSGELANDASDRIDQVFAAIGAEAEDYYLVGFNPQSDPVGARGRYHHVTVRVKRQDVRVSTRTGFAFDDEKTTPGRRQTIDRALAAPFPQQSLPIQYTTYVMRGSAAGSQRVMLSLSAELPVASPNDRKSADVVFVVRAASDGHVAASGTDSIPLPTAASAGSTTGIGAYRVQFEVPAGEYLMRAVVRAPDGLVGSADRHFKVRALDGPALTSSDLVVASPGTELPVRAAVYTGDGLDGVIDVYARTANQLQDARVVVDVVPVGQDTAAVSGFAELEDVRPTPGGVAREARIAVPLTGVVPGRYVVRASTKSGNDTAAEVVREIDVVAGTRPAAVLTERTNPADPREVAGGALAQQYIERLAAKRSPRLADARRGLDRLSARDYPGAIEAFNEVLNGEAATDADASHWPAAATAFFIGWADDFAGQDRDAISAWRRAAYLDPTIVPVHLALADLYVRLSQPALAVQVLKAALTTLPATPELQDRLSRLEKP